MEFFGPTVRARDQWTIGVPGDAGVVVAQAGSGTVVARSGFYQLTAATTNSANRTLEWYVPIPPQLLAKQVRLVRGRFSYRMTFVGPGSNRISDNVLSIYNPDDETVTDIDKDLVNIVSGTTTHAFSNLPSRILSQENPGIVHVLLRFSAWGGGAGGSATIAIRGMYFTFDAVD